VFLGANNRAPRAAALQLNRDGLTIVLVTHNAELAREAGGIVWMKDGRVVTTDGVTAAL